MQARTSERSDSKTFQVGAAEERPVGGLVTQRKQLPVILLGHGRSRRPNDPREEAKEKRDEIRKRRDMIDDRRERGVEKRDDREEKREIEKGDKTYNKVSVNIT